MANIQANEEIQILLAEYSSIRDHIIARTNVAIQIITIGAGAVAIITPHIDEKPLLSIITIAVTVLAMGIVTWVVTTDLKAEATQVRVLEKRINHLAGKRILTWETDHGVVHGLVRPFRRKE